MSERDKFVEEFKELLEALPSHSVGEWLYAYRQVAHTMGVEILRRFPEAIIGPPPSANPEFVIVRGPEQAGGPSTGPGGWPSIICKLTCMIFELYPEFPRKADEAR